jgi:hypothetical protein
MSLLLTFNEQLQIELVKALGTALFVTLGGGLAAWWVTTRSQDAKARHERRASIVQRVAALVGGLSAELDEAWADRIGLARRTFGIEPEQWIGEAGEAVFPADPRTAERVTERINGGIGDSKDSIEVRFQKFVDRRPSGEQLANIRLLLVSLSVLETEIRAHYSRSSPVLASFEMSARLLRARASLLTGELSPAVRKEELGDVFEQDRGAPAGAAAWTWLQRRYDETRKELIEQLLSAEIRLG